VHTRNIQQTSTWIFTQGKWGCRKRAEVKIRVGLIVGSTVFSCQYSFLVHFHHALVHFVLRELFIFSNLHIPLFIPPFSGGAKHVVIYIAYAFRE